jgi:hypothetical protein
LGKQVSKHSVVSSAHVVLGLLLVLLLVLSAGCRSYHPATTTTEPTVTLWPVPWGNGYETSDYKWGYIDAAGNWVIQPRFEAANLFTEGLAPVKQDGKWGYIDETGTVVIEPQFTEAYGFGDGLARVATGPPPDSSNPLQTASGYGFIDKTGTMVIPAEWDVAGGFAEGLAAVMRGPAAGFINTKGKLVIPLKFDAVGPFSEGLAQASVDGKCGYVGTVGIWTIGPEYACLPIKGVLANGMTYVLGGRFKSGLAPVYLEGDPERGGTCHYIDRTGAKAFAQVFQRGGEFSEGLAPVCVGDKWGFIDTSGTMVIEPQFDSPAGYRSPDFYLRTENGFHEGLAAVALDHKVGYIDKTGAFVVAPQYTYGGRFLGGFAYVATEAAKVPYGLIDTTGRVVYRSSTAPGTPSTGPAGSTP